LGGVINMTGFRKIKRGAGSASWRRKNERGVSLVELSIVLVILGFLIAAISSGSSMIEQSQLRAIATDMGNYGTAYNNFYNAYRAIPGDMKVASSYWSGCATAANGCDGNNDGIITLNSSTANLNEVNAAWKHLELAGLINAKFTADPASTTTAAGTQAPRSRIEGAYFMVGATTTAAGSIGANVSNPFPANKNAIYLGVNPAAGTNTTPAGSALRPQQAYNIDVKIDDGGVEGTKFMGANSGTFRAIEGSNPSTGAAAAATEICSDNAAAGTGYKVDTTTPTCIIGQALN
jgi:prepilin-type N-terminal cleavage/methylation domain-containing protein